MGKQSRLYGLSISEIAESEGERYAEVATSVADAAVKHYKNSLSPTDDESFAD